jgi:hypothetical protein
MTSLLSGTNGTYPGENWPEPRGSTPRGRKLSPEDDLNFTDRSRAAAARIGTIGEVWDDFRARCDTVHLFRIPRRGTARYGDPGQNIIRGLKLSRNIPGRFESNHRSL